MTETEVGIGIVGAGSLGGALARRLTRLGDAPGRLWSQHPQRAAELAAELGWRLCPDAAEVVLGGPLTLLCVPDRALPELAAELAVVLEPGPTRPVVAHCAGAVGPEVLAPLAARGLETAVFHPLAPVPDGSPESLEGTYVSNEGAPRGRGALTELARRLRLEPLQVSGLDRPLYHAAAAFAGVLPVLLEELAELLGREAGGGEAMAPALRALFLAGARNTSRLGPEWAQSGPQRRRDQGTVEAHRAALRRREPSLARLYDAFMAAAPAVAAPPAPQEDS